MTKDEITDKLDAAGIEYDGRLSSEKLRALLPEGEAETVRIIVMHATGIQLGSQAGPESDGYCAFRWNGEIPKAEYDAICAMDDSAGRDHRLMVI